MRARRLSLLLLTFVVEGASGCVTPADCADQTCGCIQPIAARPAVPERAREAPAPRRALKEGQAW